jgi:hypothetical protein
MGCRILESRDGRMAALYCSTSDVAFGPLFESAEEAHHFCTWLKSHGRADRCVFDGKLLLNFLGHDAMADPRSYTNAGLESQVADFRYEQMKEQIAQEDAHARHA